MPAVHPDAELAPRDVVARALFRASRPADARFLDAPAASGARLAGALPHRLRRLPAPGLDPRAGPVPVSPAAHYHMGGVAVDGGAAPRCRACGPAARWPRRACTAPTAWPRNSLLEALVFGAARGRCDLAARGTRPSRGASRRRPRTRRRAASSRSAATRSTRSAAATHMWEHVGPGAGRARACARRCAIERLARHLAPAPARLIARNMLDGRAPRRPAALERAREPRRALPRGPSRRRDPSLAHRTFTIAGARDDGRASLSPR